MEETVSLQEIYGLLKKNLVMIITTMFVGLGLAALVTFMVITPKYSATSQLIATSSNKDNAVNTDKINTNLLMINTYKDFIQGRVVTETAREKLAEKEGFNGTAEDIRNMTTVEQTQNSQMFSIKVTSPSPKEASDVSNIISEIFRDEATNYIDADKISIISPAETPTQPVSPNATVNLAIGAVLGIIIGVGLTFLAELFNKTVRSEDFISDKLNIPILGIVPLVDSKEMKQIQKAQVKILKDGEFELEEYQMSTDIYGEVDGLDLEESDLSETIDLSELNIFNQTNVDTVKDEVIIKEDTDTSRSQRRRV